MTQTAESDHYPDPEQDLGDGTYYENFDVETLTRTDDGQERTYYRYKQILHRYPTEPRVPEEVDGWQLQAVLDEEGLTPHVEGLLELLPEPGRTYAKRAWQNGTTFRRQSATVILIGQALEKTDAELDEYFRRASNIVI